MFSFVFVRLFVDGGEKQGAGIIDGCLNDLTIVCIIGSAEQEYLRGGRGEREGRAHDVEGFCSRVPGDDEAISMDGGPHVPEKATEFPQRLCPDHYEV